MKRLILASGSSARRSMLETAGVEFAVVPANVDEAAIRDRLRAENPAVPFATIAEELAIEKALEVSARHPESYVIGSDQILGFGTTILEKPRSMADARTSLLALRGITHMLLSAAALAQDGKVIWKHTSSAKLTMRAFSDAELDRYLARVSDDALTSVGAYKIEGPAIALFDDVSGDHWTILGMPLLPVLEALRERDLIS